MVTTNNSDEPLTSTEQVRKVEAVQKREAQESLEKAQKEAKLEYLDINNPDHANKTYEELQADAHKK